ncbi:MAG: nicotinate-nucleotide adenylyltransferase [Rhodomicrobiaceae bacterium]
MIAKPPVAFPSMRIGLLGGSFNPAHAGHRHISLAAMQRLQLHEVWWLVTPSNPLKRGQELASFDERMAAARAIAAHPKIKVTGFEAALPSPYAIDTVRFLQTRYPGVKFVWLMGGDNLAQLHRWRQWTGLFDSVPILVMDRPRTRHRAFASPAAIRFAAARLATNAASDLFNRRPPVWTYLNLPLCDLSSTAIRARRGERQRAVPK